MSRTKLLEDSATLDECLTSMINGTTKPQNEEGNGYLVSRIETIQNAKFDTDRMKYIDNLTSEYFDKFKYQYGDIALSHINSYEHIGKTAIYEGEPKDLIHGMNLLRLRPNLGRCIPKYMYWFMQSLTFRRAVQLEVSHSVNQCSINQKKLKTIHIPLFSLDDQKKIVDSIEKYFFAIDMGIEKIKLTNTNLNIYKKSVLNAAIRGKLIPQEDNDEPASIFLEEIKAKKESLIRLGRLKKEKRHQLINLDEVDFKLPRGWEWVRLETLINSIQAGKSFKCDERPPVGDEVGVVKVSAVTWGEYDESQSKTCMNDNMINPQYFVQEGDFLFSRANTIELVGAVVIAKNVNLKVMLSDKILRFHFVDESVKYWVLLCLRSQYGRTQIQKKSTGNQESMRNIGQQSIKNIAIPMPSKREREKIMKIVKQLNDEECFISETLTRLSRFSEILKQSILKKAFEGELA